MKKNGFTLMELLAVIAVLAILTIMVVPNILKYYNTSIEEFFKQQQGNVVDATNLYVQDYCTRKVSADYSCTPSYEAPTGDRYVCVKTIQALDYIGEIKYKGNVCEGMVIFDASGKNGEAYLYCGRNADNTYNYKTSDSVSIKTDCKK